MSHGIKAGDDDASRVDLMLDSVEEHFDKRGESNDFIESLREQWNTRSSLSEKQVAALEKFYDRID